MSKYMARIYAEVIRKTDMTGKTIEDVPENLRERVAAMLIRTEVAVKEKTEAEIVVEIRKRVEDGENLREIIAGMDLNDEEKWNLEKLVKEG